MSFLRRVDPDPEELYWDDFSDDSSDGTPPQRPPPQSPVQELWHYTAAGKLFVTAVTGDSRFIIAGSQTGEILFFDLAGRLLWKGQVTGAVNRLAVADEAECFIAGTIDRGQNAYVWHFSGQLLHTLPTGGAVWGTAITPDASLMVVGSLDQHLYAFNRDGERLFKESVGGEIRHLALTADGEHIFVGSDDHHVHAYDRAGQRRWTFQTGGRVWAGIRIAEQARVLVAGSNDGLVYGLDFDGRERWRFSSGGPLNNLVITPDGQLCAAAGQSNMVHLLNDQGNVLWEYQTKAPVYGLALSPVGPFMAVGSIDGILHLIDHRNGSYRAWKHTIRGRVYGAAITPTGQYVAAACSDKTLYILKNTLAKDDPDWLTCPPSKPLMRLVVQRVRAEYATAPHAGLVRWFTEFEKSLRSGQFDACQALLDEVHNDGGIPLSDGEKQYTRSLEGVFWLLRGAAHHRLGQIADARTYYERSKAIQERLNNQDGVGQVVAALSLLPASEETEDESRSGTPSLPDITDECLALLAEITNKPRVLGLAEKLLTHRLEVVQPAEQLQIVLLAQKSGYLSPLLKALSAGERVIRSAASAALVMLDPGPDYAVLQRMLISAEPFVQWQALRMLRDRADKHADQFKEAQERFWPAVLASEVAHAPDPLTRREAALLVKDAGSASDTPWLIERMDDPDADVQIAVAEALGEVGDRRALLRLRRTPGRAGFMGRDLAMAASDARNAIEDRYPLPTIEQVILCGEDPLARSSVQQSSLFLANTDTVYGVVTVDHVQPGAQITVRWLTGEAVLKEEQHTIREEQPRIAQIQETESVEPDQGLVPAGRRPLRRPPGRDSSDDPPRFSPFRRRTPDETGESSDEPSSPFPRRSPFSREESRPGSVFGRREERSAPARPSPFGDRSRPATPPQRRPFGDRPPLGGSAPARPARAPFGTARPGSPFGQRETERPTVPPRHVDPNENAEPGGAFAADEEQPASRPAPRFPGRFGSGLPRPDSSRAADLPPWLRGEPGEEEPAGQRPPAFERPPVASSSFSDRSALLRSRFGRPEEAAPDRPIFGRRLRPNPSDTARQIVVSLPRPADGWQSAAYGIEVTIDGESSKRDTPFKFIESLKLLGLEPGVAAQDQADFNRTPVFLSGTQYIDCLAHLEDVPVNTPVRGRLYSASTGTLLAENTVHAPKQGQQAVQLTWEHARWPTGHYRVVVSVPQGNELSTDVEVVSRIQADRITLCHRADKNSGSIGANWPFRPGDTCCCVVEFDTPPPGVEVSATWYRKGQSGPISQSRPVTTTSDTDQRKVFNLGHILLTPGHYSVVIEGKHLVREERTFEVLPYSRAQIIARLTDSIRQHASPLVQKYPLAQALLSLMLTTLLAGAFWLADSLLNRTVDAGTRAGDVMLQVAHGISQPGPLLWLAFGISYSVMVARYNKHIGSKVEARFFETSNLLLAFAGSALAWYVVCTILFEVGSALFDQLFWLSPVIVWLGPLVGVGLTERQREDDKGKPFHLSVALAVGAAIVFMGVGWLGAGIGRLLLGAIGGVAGNLLDLAHVENDLSGIFATVGAGLGFVLGAISLVLYSLRREIATLWNEWQQEHREWTLLSFLMEADGVPFKTRDYLKAAEVSGLLLALLVTVTVAIWAALEPAILPVLNMFYRPADRPAFEHAVTSAPLAVSLALALLLVWPILVWAIYRRLLLPAISLFDIVFVRRNSLILAALVGIVPIAILIAARSTMGGELHTEVGLFWTNRAAMAALVAGCVVWLVFLIPSLPVSLRPAWDLRLSADEVVIVGAAVIAGLWLPGWMWAILVIAALAVVSSAALLHRVR